MGGIRYHNMYFLMAVNGGFLSRFAGNGGIGAYTEDDIANLINTEVDEGNKAGHEPLRRACTIQKTLKVISYVFGIPMKTLFHLCGSESFARCQHDLGMDSTGRQMRGQCNSQAVVGGFYCGLHRNNYSGQINAGIDTYLKRKFGDI